MDNNSLAHTKWNCKYHIVFAPKYRRQIIYKQISADIGQIIRTLCARKGIEIIEAAAMPDHIHLYVSIPPKYDEIIAKAVMQKLTDGIEFFTADDILKVAGIDNTKLRQIHETIKKKSLEAALPLEEIG